MKIRRLEIQGFKSFADRTVLRFGEGITGVVGPNGCGKSNIVDAIRWVMGEQSAKHLRGAGMQDVIFAGSESRGPSGLSEVTITFKNDGQLVPPEYQRMDEISVTRRLFRDGTSEYAINRVQCRLRDILDLFMGTGIGKNAYSIIEQGRIGLIVTAKPEDRRAIIEDAAGVSRYKARRKQAERRIQATEQNLLRVTDITDELAVRLKDLEKQAKKAEKYKRIKGELRVLELHAASHRYLELCAKEQFEASKEARLWAKVEADEQAIGAQEAKVKEAAEYMTSQDEALRERELQTAEKQQALALAHNNAEFLAREQSKLEERGAEAKTEQQELDAERVRLLEEQASAESLGESLGASDDEEHQALETHEKALEDAQAGLEEAQTKLDADKQAMVEALTAIAEHKNNLGNLQRTRQDLEERIATTIASEKVAAKQAKEASKKAQGVSKVLNENRQLKLSLEDERSTQEELLTELGLQRAETEARLTEAKEALIGRRQKAASLLEIQKNYEGCTDAVRQIMQEKERTSDIGTSLHGLVADVISAEPRFEAAVEAVLGERLEYIIVNSQSDGLASLQFLKENAHGRSSFVPLDLREDHVSWLPRQVTTRPPEGASSVAPPVPDLAMEDAPTAVPEPLKDNLSALPMPSLGDDVVLEPLELWPDMTDPSVIGKMVDLVKAQPGYEHVARVLLGDVVVVEDLDHAQSLWQSNGHLKTLVTLSGEVLDPVGVLTGGSVGGRNAGMLAQKRQIKELTEQIQILEAKVAIAKEEHDTLHKRIEAIKSSVNELADKRHQEELSIVNLERDLKRLEEDAAREEDARKRFAEEAHALREKQAQLQKNTEGSESSIEALEQKRTELENRVSEGATHVGTLKDALKQASEAVTEVKVQAAANREKRDSSKRNLARVVQRLKDVETRLTKLTDIIKTAAEETIRLGTRIQDTQSQARDLEEELEKERSELVKARAELDHEQRALRDEDTDIRTRRNKIDKAKESANKAAMRVQKIQLDREKLVEKVADRYRLNLPDVVVEYHGEPPQTDEHKKTAEKLRRQLDNIGAINLTAIEEFQSVDERHSFLSRQKKDLEDAIQSLKSAIRRINRTSNERYIEAFRMVNEKFQVVFPKLFNGGRCALVMTDESDPLESGIEVLAQPPGKKLQNVSLLSGGEKALTAVALIFGIFLIKPTPFCLLDEVDAPLDEANVGRYNEMLRDMSSISQFILITHNKRTMELPDRLYGVTMEEPGISKLVPVDVKTNQPSNEPVLEAAS